MILLAQGKAMNNLFPKQLIVERVYNWYRQTMRHSNYRWLLILGSLLYLLNPLDILPDTFPIIGWIDDSVVATLLVAEVSQLLLDRFKNNPNSASNSETKTIDVEVVSPN